MQVPSEICTCKESRRSNIFKIYNSLKVKHFLLVEKANFYLSWSNGPCGLFSSLLCCRLTSSLKLQCKMESNFVILGPIQKSMQPPQSIMQFDWMSLKALFVKSTIIILCWYFTKCLVFVSVGNQRCQTLQNIGRYRKIKSFILETTNLTDLKLFLNDSCMVHYKFYVSI